MHSFLVWYVSQHTDNRKLVNWILTSCQPQKVTSVRDNNENTKTVLHSTQKVTFQLYYLSNVLNCNVIWHCQFLGYDKPWVLSYLSWMHDYSSPIFKFRGCETIHPDSSFSKFTCWLQIIMESDVFTDNLPCVCHSFVQKKASGRMPRSSQNQRFGAVGMLESGTSVSATARHCGVLCCGCIARVDLNCVWPTSQWGSE